MKVETTEQFDADREQQLRWYLVESKLDSEPAIELATRFGRAVDTTLELVGRTPDIGRRRWPDWSDVEVRSFRISPPFNRFLVFYVREPEVVRAIRLLEGHRKQAEK